MDVHSLMALRVRPQLDDAAADADFESKARKVEYVNTDEAHVASFFSRSLPATWSGSNDLDQVAVDGYK